MRSWPAACGRTKRVGRRPRPPGGLTKKGPLGPRRETSPLGTRGSPGGRRRRRRRRSGPGRPRCGDGHRRGGATGHRPRWSPRRRAKVAKECLWRVAAGRRPPPTESKGRPILRRRQNVMVVMPAGQPRLDIARPPPALSHPSRPVFPPRRVRPSTTDGRPSQRRVPPPTRRHPTAPDAVRRRGAGPDARRLFAAPPPGGTPSDATGVARPSRARPLDAPGVTRTWARRAAKDRKGRGGTPPVPRRGPPRRARCCRTVRRDDGSPPGHPGRPEGGTPAAPPARQLPARTQGPVAPGVARPSSLGRSAGGAPPPSSPSVAVVLDRPN